MLCRGGFPVFDFCPPPPPFTFVPLYPSLEEKISLIKNYGPQERLWGIQKNSAFVHFIATKELI